MSDYIPVDSSKSVFYQEYADYWLMYLIKHRGAGAGLMHGPGGYKIVLL